MNIVYERDVDALHNHPCAARDAASRESAARNQHAPARSVCFVRRDRPSRGGHVASAGVSMRKIQD